MSTSGNFAFVKLGVGAPEDVGMTDQDLSLIEQLATAATAGELVVGQADPRYRPIDWMMECLSHGHGKVFCVAEDGGEARIMAVTGNGPTAEANARFVSVARKAVLALTAEVRRLRREEGAAMTAVSQLCECSGECFLAARVEEAVCRYFHADPDLYLVVDGCRNGPDPGSTLAQVGPGWKLYRTVSGVSA